MAPSGVPNTDAKPAGVERSATLRTAGSSCSQLVLGGAPGSDVISNVTADPTAVVGLQGGLGGYTTAAQVVSALRSDGHGAQYSR